MMRVREGFSSVVKLCVLLLLAMSLCFVFSCKKSSPEPSQQQVEESPKSDANDVEKPGPDVPETPDVSEEPNTVKETPTEVQVKPGFVAIKLELPKPMFVGTPQDTKVPNLEKPLGTKRPDFLAPVGTTNVALGKPVTASDEEPIIGETEYITDDDKEAADGSYVEYGPFLQHVTIDLEGKHEIYALVVWHYHKQAVVYYDVVVQIADDPDFITNVKTVFNNDIDNTAGLGVGKDKHYTETSEGKLIDCLAQGAQGRYVRLYSYGNTSNDMNHYIEVAVYGKPAG